MVTAAFYYCVPDSNKCALFSRSPVRCVGGVCVHLNASLRQVDADSQSLPHAHVGVLCLLEGFLQSLQLRHCEGRAAAALLLLVSIPSLQNKLWAGQRETQGYHQSHSAASPLQKHYHREHEVNSYFPHTCMLFFFEIRAVEV